MSFEKEFKLVVAGILFLIPFNPTNMFVDLLTEYFFDYSVTVSEVFFVSGRFGWEMISIVLVAKIILAIAEVILLSRIYEKWTK